MNTRPMFLAGALLLAACQFQAHTTVQPDGAGELRTEVGFTAEERQNLIQQGTSNAGDFCNSAQQSSRNVTVTEAQRGAMTWCVTATRFRDLDELRGLYAEQKGVTVNRLAVTDNKFEYEVALDTSSADSSLANFTAITWTVTLPGAPLSHNAAQVSGNTLTWAVTPRSGVVNLRAESAVEKTGLDWSSPLVIAAVAAGGVLLGMAGAVLIFRRARSAAAP